MKRQSLPGLVGIAAAMLSVAGASAQSDSSDGLKFFESRIRPVLAQHCYECHSTQAGKSRGGLKVDTRDALRRGGDSGAGVVPKSPAESLIYQALLHRDDGLQMPPKGKLPQSVIDDFRKWIEIGAPDPRITEVSREVASSIDIAKGRDFWAYRPLAKSLPPQSEHSNWARTPIDRFVVAGLKERGLTPAGDAAPLVLVRRLHFIITGLPPSPEDLQKWTRTIEAAANESAREKAIAGLIESLLASPRYGERWGRHWLDVARFAESTGGDHNNVYQHAWRYRDYVIDAFNGDKAFDQFLREQIAGDLLPIANDAEWAGNVIATGFLAVGVKSVGEEDQQKYLADLVDEQIDATTRAFLATTVACARCHDHKFDAIPQQDYYALAAIFRSTETHYGLLKAQARQATTLLDLTGMGPTSGTAALSNSELAALIKARDAAAKAVADAMTKIRAGENVFRGTLRRLRSQRDETEAALQAYSKDGQPRVFAMGTQDRDAPLATRLLVRGEIDKPAQLVPRGVLQVLSPPRQHQFPPRVGGSGRRELAEWITGPAHSLTARVAANRIWHWMFGRGLVRTVDDFGHAGELPTHPELLDYLASRLIENRWSIKSLVREIANSRTWQLASSHDPGNFAIDPDNAWLWRMSPRRLEAEAIRDAMLAVSGNLDLRRPAGTYLRDVGEGGVGQNVFEPAIRALDAKTRSVYLPRVRSVLPEMLETFDAPDAGLVTGSRETTSSALQSLFLMNHPFVQSQAEGLSRGLMELKEEQRIRAAYERTLGRPPTVREEEIAADFLSRFREQPRQAASRSDAAEPGPSDTLGPRTAAANGSNVRGRRGGRAAGAEPPSSVQVQEPHPPMSALAVFCHALLCSTEFQTIE